MSSIPPHNTIVSSGEPEEVLLTASVEDRWIAAVHEAGHAVIAVVVGYCLKDVSIEGALRCRAQPEMAEGEPSGGISSPEVDDEERDAIYTLAGGKAEVSLPGSDQVERFSTSDREYFRTLGPGAVDSGERLQWRRMMELKAEAAVSANWNWIEAVARRLRKDGMLLASQVRLTRQA